MKVKSFFETDLPKVFLLRRLELNLRQVDVAGKLGISTMGLSYLENGSRGLKLKTLERWAEILDLDIFVEVKPK